MRGDRQRNSRWGIWNLPQTFADLFPVPSNGKTERQVSCPRSDKYVFSRNFGNTCCFFDTVQIQSQCGFICNKCFHFLSRKHIYYIEGVVTPMAFGRLYERRLTRNDRQDAVSWKVLSFFICHLSFVISNSLSNGLLLFGWAGCLPWFFSHAHREGQLKLKPNKS